MNNTSTEKVIISCPCHNNLQIGLQKLGYTVLYKPDINLVTLRQEIQNCAGLIVSTRLSIQENLLNQAEQLRWIGRLGSGVDHIDVQAAERLHIQVITSPEGNAPSVGEHTLGLLFAAIKNIPSANNEIKEHIWERAKNRTQLLSSMTIGIIGYGHTGQAFGELLAKLNCKILIYDIRQKNALPLRAKQVDLKTIQSNCDVISLHIDYTNGNHHFANLNFFKSLSGKPIFINTSRGACVDTKALLLALDKQYISYACLDVLENEEISTFSKQELSTLNTLCNHDNVIITPHIAGVSHESFVAMSEILLAKITTL